MYYVNAVRIFNNLEKALVRTILNTAKRETLVTILAKLNFADRPQYVGDVQRATEVSKRATNKKYKALKKTEFFAEHDQLSLSDISLELFLIQIVFESQLTAFSYTVYWLFLVLTIAIRANIVVSPGYDIHSYGHPKNAILQHT